MQKSVDCTPPSANGFNEGLTYFSSFSFKCCESVVLYSILLEFSLESEKIDFLVSEKLGPYRHKRNFVVKCEGDSLV